jgi:hypothetical protein
VDRTITNKIFQPGMMDFPKSNVPTGVTEWASPNGPFPELAAFSLAVCKPPTLKSRKPLID